MISFDKNNSKPSYRLIQNLSFSSSVDEDEKQRKSDNSTQAKAD